MKVNNSTALINIETQEYPVYLGAIRSIFSNISFPEEVDQSVVEELGYSLVEHTVMPSGDVVTEGKPELVDGVWKRTWTVRNYNDTERGDQLTARKKELLDKLGELVTEETEIGFPYVAPSGVEVHIQLRMVDRINLIALKGEADYMVGVQSVSLMEFRPYENISIFLSPAQMSEMAGSALVAMKKLYKASWTVKDQIIAALSVEELPEIPATLF
jgi:hypothetical protein